MNSQEISKFENKPAEIDLKGTVLSIGSTCGLVSLVVSGPGIFEMKASVDSGLGLFLDTTVFMLTMCCLLPMRKLPNKILKKFSKENVFFPPLKERMDCNVVPDCCNQSANARFRYSLVCGRLEHLSGRETVRGHRYRTLIADEVDAMRRDLLKALREWY